MDLFSALIFKKSPIFPRYAEALNFKRTYAIEDEILCEETSSSHALISFPLFASFSPTTTTKHTTVFFRGEEEGGRADLDPRCVSNCQMPEKWKILLERDADFSAARAPSQSHALWPRRRRRRRRRSVARCTSITSCQRMLPISVSYGIFSSFHP